MKRTWIMLYGWAALLTIGQPTIAAENSKACTNQTPGGIKAVLTTTSNTVYCTSDIIGYDKVTYPLNGFEGEIVRVKLLDPESGTETFIGPCESPKELCLQFPDAKKMTYSITIEEVNPETGKWVEVCQFTRSNYPNMIDEPDSR